METTTSVRIRMIIIGFIFGFITCYFSFTKHYMRQTEICEEALDSISIGLEEWIEYFEGIPIDTVGDLGYSEWIENNDTIRI